MELPVTIQLNAECLLDWRHRHTLLKLLKEGRAHVLGSDCHGAHHRVPNLAEGRAVIEKKLGRSILDQLDQRGTTLLEEVRTDEQEDYEHHQRDIISGTGSTDGL